MQPQVLTAAKYVKITKKNSKCMGGFFTLLSELQGSKGSEALPAVLCCDISG